MKDIPAKDAPQKVKAAYLGINAGFQVHKRIPSTICATHHISYEQTCPIDGCTEGQEL